MEEEHKEKPKEEKKPRIPFKVKLTTGSIIVIIITIAFIVLVSIPTYLPKGECEVARPNFECSSVKEVMTENCDYWGNYDCNTDADVSLPQVEWYIENLCNLQNQYHNTGLDCSNLRSACNEISGKQLCSSSYIG